MPLIGAWTTVGDHQAKAVAAAALRDLLARTWPLTSVTHAIQLSRGLFVMVRWGLWHHCIPVSWHARLAAAFAAQA